MLETALKITDLDHLVFGTDWPFPSLFVNGSGDDPAPAFAALSSADRAKIDGLTAAALVPRLGPHA